MSEHMGLAELALFFTLRDEHDELKKQVARDRDRAYADGYQAALRDITEAATDLGGDR